MTKSGDIGVMYAEPDILVGFFTIGDAVAYGENAIALTRQKTGGFKAYSRCGATDDDGLFHNGCKSTLFPAMQETKSGRGGLVILSLLLPFCLFLGCSYCNGQNPSFRNFLRERCVIPFSSLVVNKGVALMTYFGWLSRIFSNGPNSRVRVDSSAMM